VDECFKLIACVCFVVAGTSAARPRSFKQVFL